MIVNGIFRAAFDTCRLAIVIDPHGQLRSAAARPSMDPAWISIDECKWRDVLRHHGAGAYEGILPDLIAADDSRVGTDRGASSDDGGRVFMFA